MKMRIIEWPTGDNKFHLEFYSDYDEEWHLRVFENGLPCIFKTLVEAKTYAIDNRMEPICKIHNV